VSDNTVKFHLNSVFNKLGCRTRAEATRLGVERGLISSTDQDSG
jgi:DNA-binding CsgD family transcriptional regulator